MLYLFPLGVIGQRSLLFFFFPLWNASDQGPSNREAISFSRELRVERQIVCSIHDMCIHINTSDSLEFVASTNGTAWSFRSRGKVLSLRRFSVERFSTKLLFNRHFRPRECCDYVRNALWHCYVDEHG